MQTTMKSKKGAPLCPRCKHDPPFIVSFHEGDDIDIKLRSMCLWCLSEKNQDCLVTLE